MENVFPFGHLPHNELLDLSFNTIFTFVCLNHGSVVPKDYGLLDKLDFSKLRLSEKDELSDNDIDNYVELHSNFDYYTMHGFHKLVKNTKGDSDVNQLSVMHSNICWLLGNIEKV